MSTGCDHAIEYIYQYLDEEISSYHATRIKVHLKRCSACMDAYQFETKLKTVIRERGKTEPPAELFDTLRALIQQERRETGPDV